jgi:hypothetical protein
VIIRHKYTEIRIAIATYDAPDGGDTYRATVFTRVPMSPDGGYWVQRRDVGVSSDRTKAVARAVRHHRINRDVDSDDSDWDIHRDPPHR